MLEEVTVLSKTTILPTDDANLAERLLTRLIHEEAYILLAVLGAGPDAETTVERASRFTGEMSDPYWVVWIRQPTQVATLLEGLKGDDDALQQLPDARAFVLNLADRVMDVIRRDEPLPDLARLSLAWMRGEAAS